MLYTKKQYFMLSLLAAKYDEQGRYKNPIIKLHLLTSVFKNSLDNNINIFEVNDEKLQKLIENTFNKESRYYKNRVRNSKQVLLDTEIIEEIENQSVKEMGFCDKEEISFLTYEDKKYPERLRKIELSPVIIFYKGKFPKDKELKNSYAVIGSREIDEKGKQVAYSFGRLLSENGYWNISGLAEGSDAYGHLGSVKTQGLTGAILAHGLAEPIYPSSNNNLADKIINSGGFLLSELPPSIKVQSHFFTRRDRLQSGLTKGVLVVETGEKGGTLHTVNYALKQNKFVGVWKPSDYNDKNEYIKGNLMLLQILKPTNKFKIKSKKKLNKIIAIRDKDDILKLLDNETNTGRADLFTDIE
ncbi:MAG: DNA-processing protein DprA [bacterium]